MTKLNQTISTSDRLQIIGEMQGIWDSIGHDVLDLSGGEMERDQVLELVAHHMRDDFPVEWMIFSELSPILQGQIVKQAFPENSFCR